MIKKLTVNFKKSNGSDYSPSVGQSETTSSRHKKSYQNEENYKPKKMFTLSKYQNNNFGLSSYGSKR